MPRASLKKTKSVLNRLPGWVWPVSMFVVAMVISVALAYTGHPSSSEGSSVLRLEHGVYTLDVARSDAAQQKGLGGRQSMAADHGMLFVFSSQANQCFWMKDMRFPLDIIWVGSDKKVTQVEAGLSPATYPQAYCAQARYVIELNSGTAAGEDLTVGTQLSF